MHIKHFLLTADGRIREFNAEEAARIANGVNSLPEYADSSLRYVQVVVDDPDEDDSLHVKSAGALLRFDHEGHLSEAEGNREDEDAVSRFEHDTCIQLALKDTVAQDEAIH